MFKFTKFNNPLRVFFTNAAFNSSETFTQTLHNGILFPLGILKFHWVHSHTKVLDEIKALEPVEQIKIHDW